MPGPAPDRAAALHLAGQVLAAGAPSAYLRRILVRRTPARPRPRPIPVADVDPGSWLRGRPRAGRGLAPPRHPCPPAAGGARPALLRGPAGHRDRWGARHTAGLSAPPPTADWSPSTPVSPPPRKGPHHDHRPRSRVRPRGHSEASRPARRRRVARRRGGGRRRSGDVTPRGADRGPVGGWSCLAVPRPKSPQSPAGRMPCSTSGSWRLTRGVEFRRGVCRQAPTAAPWDGPATTADNIAPRPGRVDRLFALVGACSRLGRRPRPIRRSITSATAARSPRR